MRLPQPDNEEKRLLAEYQTASAFYSWVANELSQHSDAAREFEAFQNVVKVGKAECERTKLALDDFRKAKRR